LPACHQSSPVHLLFVPYCSHPPYSKPLNFIVIVYSVLISFFMPWLNQPLTTKHLVYMSKSWSKSDLCPNDVIKGLAIDNKTDHITEMD
jgi:hypothetical protein